MNNDRNPCCDLLSKKEKKISTFLLLQQWRTVKTLAASLHHIYDSEGQWKPLPRAYDVIHGWMPVSFPCRESIRFYTVYCPFHFLAVILYGFTRFSASAAKLMREKREREPLSRSRTVLCRFIYPNLSIRLKKYTFFIHFSLFFALKTAVYSAFFPRFFSHRVKNVRA
jgi:hypothetical protein